MSGIELLVFSVGCVVMFFVIALVSKTGDNWKYIGNEEYSVRPLDSEYGMQTCTYEQINTKTGKRRRIKSSKERLIELNRNNSGGLMV